ncbi:beta-galactosidase GalB [Ohtaekwangia koreensis]|uniref:Beta-galactosidase n=1 Tax=Ohtaekwangia koreensis TaxID=688867 RepID=A0A1T5IUE3_9BACT|nr:beta-galactosidase GalB [Ohtaekwangia koreensis]SKC42799.1 beta-galactosidase [Ohtaekwangia koreensis]
MIQRLLCLSFVCVVSIVVISCTHQTNSLRYIDFNANWNFSLNNLSSVEEISRIDSSWRVVNLPHDWSIEGEFNEKNPAGFGGGPLPGGVGWYRKIFTLDALDSTKRIAIQFDGIYLNSEVWVNGQSVGKRPNGYISFEYDITPFVNFDGKPNTIAVKVDNSKQPNSRWYSGSGIYRDVRLVKTSKVYVGYNGIFIRTPAVTPATASVQITATVKNDLQEDKTIEFVTEIYDPQGKLVKEVESSHPVKANEAIDVDQSLNVQQPERWSVHSPKLYKAITKVVIDGNVVDDYETVFGIRNFEFDSKKGFSLNGEYLKIKGVCLHHDLGCLGAAFNVRAAERQLEIMKSMGVNAIRTSHNPPAPQFLDLCDRMGFIVMDEMFDMWKKKKTEFDYSIYWNEWHKRDLEDFIKRDRNHPSVMVWSVGNEIGEQWDSTGTVIANELVDIVHTFDTTRPITTANNEAHPINSIIKSGALDLIGYNYNHGMFGKFPEDYPGKKFIATETTSALATRGHYDMPSDSIRVWPIAWDKIFTDGNPDNSVSAYDNVRAPWGSTHEETWKIVKKHDFLSGMFVWTGFDYIGEPTPYVWPSRSSYFGIVDLAGFPKDVYYMYQSEWTDKSVLHVFPHWNWTTGKVVDIWVYYNHADEVELFLNDKSLGVKRKTGDDLHVQWRVPFEPGVLKAISRKNGAEVLHKEIRTASKASRIVLEADRTNILATGKDLSFITVKIVDDQGNIVPDADNLVKFQVKGDGYIAGVDNGDPVSHASFKSNERKAFHGLALVVLQGAKNKGKINLTATGQGLKENSITINVE